MTAEARGSFRTDPWPRRDRSDRRARRGRRRRRRPAAARRSCSRPRSRPGVTPTQPTSARSSPLPPGTPLVESSSPLRVNGNAVFPRMVWRQCPTYYPTSIGAGINLFLGVSCSTPTEQFDRLAGRAMSTVDASTPGVGGPGQVGWHLPDEADMSVGERRAKLPQPKGDGRVTFLTLTDHFSQRAAPPPKGKEIYPGFFDRADMIGFDTYPVEVRCSLAQIDNVYWMQRELVALTGGKPTFQWIEAGPMEHCRENRSDARGRPQRDLARDRRRRARHRLLPGLVGGKSAARSAPANRDPRARPRLLSPVAGRLVDRRSRRHRRRSRRTPRLVAASSRRRAGNSAPRRYGPAMRSGPLSSFSRGLAISSPSPALGGRGRTTIFGDSVADSLNYVDAMRFSPKGSTCARS